MKANFKSKQLNFFYHCLNLKVDFKKTARLRHLVRNVICDKCVSFDMINRLIGRNELRSINRLTIQQSGVILGISRSSVYSISFISYISICTYIRMWITVQQNLYKVLLNVYVCFNEQWKWCITILHVCTCSYNNGVGESRQGQRLFVFYFPL